MALNLRVKMRRRLAAVLAAGATAAATATAVTATSAQADPAPPDHLVIAAVAGSDGGAYNSDWVELYNPTDADISLGTINGSTVTPNYYQCYRSVNGTSCSSMKLYGTVKAHHYFLIWDGHNADTAAGSVRGTPPAGIAPDLNFALDAADTAGTSTDPSGQSNNGFGGYSSGGQILLLNAASNGVYTGSGDLSSTAAKAAGVVDAVAWTKYTAGPPVAITQPGSAETDGSSTITGASAGTTNGFVSARIFSNGIPVDTDANSADFSALTTADFALHSQASDHVTVVPVDDTEVSRGEAMAAIQIHGSTIAGHSLSYAADGLPDGVAIDPASGIVSGTPSATDALKDYPVTVTVTDTWPTGSSNVTTSFTLTVSSVLRLDPVADTSVHARADLTTVAVIAHGGAPAYHFTATGLPQGVVIDPGTGEISGTPTDAVGRYAVHVGVTDSGTPAQSAAVDFTLAELPKTTGPAPSDPLSGLRINEVKATGTPAEDWVELYNTGAAVTGASVRLVDAAGESYQVPSQSIGAHAYVTVAGTDLHGAGIDLGAQDTLALTESDDTLLDETSWTSFATPTWARYPDGTGAFFDSSKGTEGTANLDPALDTDHLVIAAAFGANSDTVRWSNDWIDLYNPTDNTISLGTLSGSTVTPKYALCYRTYAATGACSSLVKLFGTVASHHHFLVWYQNAHKAPDQGTYTAGFTPDLDVSVATAANGNQTGSNMGGCNTGGQIELLDATKGTGAINGDLSSAAARAAGEVDGVGWMSASTNQPSAAESKGSATVTGLDSGTNNTCVLTRRFTGGYPVDGDANSTDFRAATGIDRIAITSVDDSEISLGEAMNPISVQAQAIFGQATYSAAGLPTGVTIDPHTGAISGTPDPADALKDYPVTLTVGDDMPSDTNTTTFTLTLGKELRLQSIADTTLHRGSATTIPVQAHGGTSPYSYAATGLPAGVTIDEASGLISGTPTDALGRYRVHVVVTDTSSTAVSASRDFTIRELPSLGGPVSGDPLAALRINEVRATGKPADDWIELYDTGTAIAGASLLLEDRAGDTYQVPVQDVAADGYVVVDGAALKSAGFALAADDDLYLTETDGTLLDSTSWTAYAPMSWARATDGSGIFGASDYTTKGTSNTTAPPVIHPNDLLVSEVNYDNNSTDYYEYSEVTNTTDHPIDFAAYGLSLTKGGAAMTLHDPSDTSAASPLADPVVAAHGTQLFWWVENQYLGVKTTSQFLGNYGLPGSTSVVLVNGFSSMANSGGDHSFDISVSTGTGTLVSRAYVDTPCAAASGINNGAVCTPTNNNYAEHYAVPTDRSSADAATWYNSLHALGDDINYPLATKLSSPGTVDLAQVGFSHAVTISDVHDTGDITSDSVTLTNTSAAQVDLAGYVLQSRAGDTYPLPDGTTVAPHGDLVVPSTASGIDLGAHDFITLLAPRGYSYTDGVGVVDTTGPYLKAVPYDASSGEDPVIDPTTGLDLPPAGGLYRPGGVSALGGTLYVANTGDNVLAAVADGSNTIVAGSLGGYGEKGNDGPAVDAQLYQPTGVVEDSHGNVFIADSGDNVIREITTDKRIHRYVGTGEAGGAGATVAADSTALSVRLWHPNGLAVDAHDNLFIADTNDDRVLKVTPAGAVTVVAGTGKGGYTGDGSAATGARLALPSGVAVDVDGNVYIADSSNNVIRRVDAATGIITTVAGDYAAGQVHNTCLGAYAGDGGQATSAQLNDPQGVAIDSSGDLFIADTFNHAIRQVTPDGIISTVVNVGGVSGAENLSPVAAGQLPGTTRLNTPTAVAVDPATNVLYIADTKNNAIAQVVHLAYAGNASGPIEPADQVAITGSGVAATACAVAQNGAIASTSAPTISGTPAVGATLTAVEGSWKPTPDSYTYQWLRDGAVIDTATSATYLVTAADAGHALSVAVTAVRAEYADGNATSVAVVVPAPVTGTPTGTPSPGTPTGTPSPGTPTGTPSPGTPTGTPSPGTPTGTPSPGDSGRLHRALQKLAHDATVLRAKQKALHRVHERLHRGHLSPAAARHLTMLRNRLQKKTAQLKRTLEADHKTVNSLRHSR